MTMELDQEGLHKKVLQSCLVADAMLQQQQKRQISQEQQQHITDFSIKAIMGYTNQLGASEQQATAMDLSRTSSSPTSSQGTGASKQATKRPRLKKFKCPYCWVSLSNTGQFTGHLRTHTGERPFKCDYYKCDKTFTRNEELTRHKRIHTGQRPYHCEQCSKRFGRKDHLKKHTRTHEKQAARIAEQKQKQQQQQQANAAAAAADDENQNTPAMNVCSQSGEHKALFSAVRANLVAAAAAVAVNNKQQATTTTRQCFPFDANLLRYI